MSNEGYAIGTYLFLSGSRGRFDETSDRVAAHQPDGARQQALLCRPECSAEAERHREGEALAHGLEGQGGRLEGTAQSAHCGRVQVSAHCTLHRVGFVLYVKVVSFYKLLCQLNHAFHRKT